MFKQNNTLWVYTASVLFTVILLPLTDINWKYQQSIYNDGKKFEPQSYKMPFQVGVFYLIYKQHF